MVPSKKKRISLVEIRLLLIVGNLNSCRNCEQAGGERQEDACVLGCGLRCWEVRLAGQVGAFCSSVTQKVWPGNY